MPNTQAYSVDWTVEVQPEGDVSDDVVSVVVQRRKDVNTATVELDTSVRPHAVEERTDITVELSDANETITFNGRVDDVSDSDREPVVTIDARTPEAQLDDTSLVGNYSEDNLFMVVNAILDDGPSRIRSITFGPEKHISEYGTFTGETVFGDFTANHYPRYGVEYESFSVGETLNGQGISVQLDFESYENTTNETYGLNLEREDGHRELVQASLELPPADSAMEAFGTERPKLALSGGAGRLASVTNMETDAGGLLAGAGHLSLEATVENYVQTTYNYQAEDETTVRDGLDSITSYLSTLDGRTWTYSVDEQTEELVMKPISPNKPSTHVYREGGNVIRPMAKRNLDGVKNFVKVSGVGAVTAWAWAYEGTYYESTENPFQNGLFPDNADSWRDSAQTNDIDLIDLRATTLKDSAVSSEYQAIDVARDALESRYRSSVSGTAPVTGVKDVNVNDRAEVYYPSRGIPQKVTSNTFTVERVEYRVENDEAQTEIDFGVSRPSAEEIIDGIVDRKLADSFTPVPGTIQSMNEDGTATVAGEDGEIYEGVQII